MTAGPLGSLPLALDGFVGRRRELTALAGLVARHRLVTLTGPAGVGKTRLAVELAGRLAARFRDGVWWVDLAAVRRDDMVVHAISRVLVSRTDSGKSGPETVFDEVADRRLLVLLDNCEHVLDGCLAIVKPLLQRCPAAHILTTSREALHLRGEQTYPVPALGLPDSAAPPSADNVVHSEAVRLFVERASQLDPDFDLTEHNASAVASICRRLDGIPLAIELAARHVRLLGATGVLTRLVGRIDLIDTDDRTTCSRHASLELAIDWSYQLLDPQTRSVWRRLSVLAGPFSVELATVVCSATEDAADRSPAAILRMLRALEAKSLLAPVPQPDGSTWLRQLEPLRAYSRMRLIAADELDATYERLVAHLLAVIEPQLTTFILPPDVCEQIAALEHHALTAIEWLTARSDDRLAVIACGLARSWMALGYNLQESRELLRDALARARGRPDHTASLLAALCKAAHRQGDYREQLRLGHQALALEMKLGRPARTASVLDLLAAGWRAVGETAMSRLCYGKTLEIVRTLGDPAILAITLNDIAWAALEWGEFDLAEAMLDEGLPLARIHSTPGRLASMLHTAGVLALVEGDLEASEADFIEALEVTNPLDGLKVPYFLEALGMVRIERGAHASGLSLIACARTVRTEKHAVAEPSWQRRVETAATNATAALDAQGAGAAIQAGSRVKLNNAVEYALSPAPDRRPTGPASPLTGQEHRVITLLTDGLTNEQIARKLRISPRTVATHLERIRDKLGIRSRPALAAWYTREGAA